MDDPIQFMAPASIEQTDGCHVVAVPYPGRGHINPMMNLCNLLVSRNSHLLITFVVTEEWFGIIGSDSKPANIRFATIPDVLPSELLRGADVQGFFQATQTEMEEPFVQLLDRFERPVKLIIGDICLIWSVKVANQRNIPVAALWPMSASVFSIYYHYDLLVQNRHIPVELSERGDEHVDYIPGISSICIADLPSHFRREQKTLHLALGAFAIIPKAQYLLFTSVYALESEAMDAMRPKFPFPVYSFGPLIPYFKLEDIYDNLDYLKWLDSQPPSSVLFISLGSFLSVSSAQMDEIAAGLRLSSVRYLWVAREVASQLKEGCGDSGVLMTWCDQLKVSCHSSVGGFWTHCGWNSVMESVFAGVPMLTFPIRGDQIPNSKLIVEDWKIGWKINPKARMDHLVKREEIARLVQMFMDLESANRTEMVRRARELREICQQAIVEDGSSETNLNDFVRRISLP